jgi:hypothetical protein
VQPQTESAILKDTCIAGEALFAILRKSKTAASQVIGNAFAALLLLPNRMGNQFNFNHNCNSTVVFLKKEVKMK